MIDALLKDIDVPHQFGFRYPRYKLGVYTTGVAISAQSLIFIKDVTNKLFGNEVTKFGCNKLPGPAAYTKWASSGMYSKILKLRDVPLKESRGSRVPRDESTVRSF
ncbi:hypothetical protein ACJJTC_017721 [Scirpophaga incertulas]